MHTSSSSSSSHTNHRRTVSHYHHLIIPPFSNTDSDHSVRLSSTSSIIINLQISKLWIHKENWRHLWTKENPGLFEGCTAGWKMRKWLLQQVELSCLFMKAKRELRNNWSQSHFCVTEHFIVQLLLPKNQPGSEILTSDMPETPQKHIRHHPHPHRTNHPPLLHVFVSLIASPRWKARCWTFCDFVGCEKFWHFHSSEFMIKLEFYVFCNYLVNNRITTCA